MLVKERTYLKGLAGWAIIDSLSEFVNVKHAGLYRSIQRLAAHLTVIGDKKLRK